MNKTFWLLVCMAWASLSQKAMAVAADVSCTVTRLDGEVILLGYPSKSPTGLPPHYRMGGKYYAYQKAHVGDQVALHNLVKTQKGAAVRLIFNYGDLIEVGENTTLRFDKKKVGLKVLPVIHLDSGSIRVAVKNGGVLSDMGFKSPIGDIRIDGTEFYMQVDKKGKTFVAVLRGAVKVLPYGKGAARERRIPEKKALMLVPGGEAVGPYFLTRKEVLGIQSKTYVSNRALQIPSLSKQKYINELEAEAFDSIMEDLLAKKPHLYNQFASDKKRWRNIDALLGFTIEKIAFSIKPGGQKAAGGKGEKEGFKPLNTIYPGDKE